MIEQSAVSFGALNYLMLALYFAVVLYVGWRFGRKVTSSRGYFIAEGRLHQAVVGLSLLGTYLSALTMMALPGAAFGDQNLTFTIQLPFLILTAIVITRFVLPRYREAGVISVYQYLEQRIHVSARVLASISFVLFSIARMGLVLYLPALAISQVTDLSLSGAILVMGVITTAYTVAGGIEAVIWTDALMVCVFVVAAVLSLGYILTGESGRQFMDIARSSGKLQVLLPGADVTKVCSIWLVLETIFSTIRIYGTQQDMTQRYLATPSTAKANQSVWISILAYIPMGYLFYFMGTALYVFYQVHPDPHLPVAKPDSIYPFFIVTQMPPGAAGLVIAGIFAAAMSSISSLMNSSSTVCVEDFLRRFARFERDDQEYLRSARWLTLLWGVAHILMALSLMGIKSGLVVWLKIMGTATNGVLGLMMLAFLPFRVDRRAAAGGFVLSYGLLFYLMFGTKLTFLLWTVLGNLSCFVIALALHFALGGGSRPHERPTDE